MVVMAASVVLLAGVGTGMNWYLALSILQLVPSTTAVPAVAPALSAASQHKPLSMFWIEPPDVNLQRMSLRVVLQSPYTTTCSPFTGFTSLICTHFWLKQKIENNTILLALIVKHVLKNLMFTLMVIVV